MIRYIDVNLTEHHLYECNCYVIGRKDENNSEIFRIHLLDEMLDKNIYMNFQKSDGTKLKSPKLEIDTTEKIATYSITNQLTDVIGILQVEIEVNDGESVIWKSSIKRYKIVDSISATDKIEAENKDFIIAAQNVVDQVNNLDIVVNKVDDITNIEIIKKDGTTETITLSDGKDGKDGVDGTDGYTPVKGIDYFDGKDGNDYVLTEEDKIEMANMAKTTEEDVTELLKNVTYNKKEIDSKIGDISNALDTINGEIV